MSIFMGSKSYLDIILEILASLVIIFLILPLHECAHGFVAYKLGDNTAKNSGRLTLNPLAHLDIMGSILMVVFGFGWAKPVPVNPLNFKKPKRDMALTALAGPVSNFLAAFFGCLLLNLIMLFKIKIDLDVLQSMMIFFIYYIKLNIGLGLFNLIPVPPLDGSRILCGFLSDKKVYQFSLYQRYFSVFLILLLITGRLGIVLNALGNVIMDGMFALVSLMFGGK